MKRLLLPVLAGLVALPVARADEDPVQAVSWVGPMRKVHKKFTGKPGTLALFGDSITVSMAFWAPLRQSPKGLDPAGAAALERVTKYMDPAGWEGRGPGFGNEGSRTIRWADKNVDAWLTKLNPEVAVILFGSN